MKFPCDTHLKMISVSLRISLTHKLWLPASLALTGPVGGSAWASVTRVLVGVPVRGLQRPLPWSATEFSRCPVIHLFATVAGVHV